ncbi:MAG: hypothetical protein JNN30_07070 [Rhodanobacteraceae bacterium]|nr:hypothetical protein [Rhodanobacteraceae bacterium]
MNRLQKMGGASALIEAALYVALFVFFGAYWQYPAEASVAEKLAYLAANKVPLYAANLFGYVLFGVALAVLVLAVHERLKLSSLRLSRLSSVFGLLWAGLVITAGMIANTGLLAVVKIAIKEPDRAFATFTTVNVIVEGIGGGNEVVGGLWVLLLSIAARGGGLSRPLSYFGMFVGSAGIATVIPGELTREIFGMSQIVWFVWLGTVLLRAR